MVSLSDHDQRGNHTNKCKIVLNTGSRATSKREIDKTLILIPVLKSFGIKCFRVFPESAAPVHYKGGHNYGISLAYIQVFNCIILNSTPGYIPNGRIQAHGFINDLVRVG